MISAGAKTIGWTRCEVESEKAPLQMILRPFGKNKWLILQWTGRLRKLGSSLSFTDFTHDAPSSLPWNHHAILYGAWVGSRLHSGSFEIGHDAEVCNSNADRSYYCGTLKLFVIPYQRGCPSLSFWDSCFLELFDATKFWHNQRPSAILWGVTITSVTGIKSVPWPKFIQMAMEAQPGWIASEVDLSCRVLPASWRQLPEFSHPLIFSTANGSEKGFPLQRNLIWVGLMSVYGLFWKYVEYLGKQKAGRYTSILH